MQNAERGTRNDELREELLSSIHHSSLPHSSFAFMEPEISRRCPGCGAAIRGSAAYCPHCGEPMQKSMNAAALAVEVPEELEESKDEGMKENAEMTAAAAPPTLEDSTSGIEQGREVSAVSAGVESRPRAKVYQDARVERRDKRRRMTNAARGAMEDKLMPRVEKMRQTSAVVLDEAAIDPSLRFVLIAIALFVIFVALLFISLLR